MFFVCVCECVCERADKRKPLVRENHTNRIKKKDNNDKHDIMALVNILLHLIIFLHIKLAIMQKPSTLNDNNPTEFNIGGVLSNNDSEDHFRDTIAVSQKATVAAYFFFFFPTFCTSFIIVLFA